MSENTRRNPSRRISGHVKEAISAALYVWNKKPLANLTRQPGGESAGYHCSKRPNPRSSSSSIPALRACSQKLDTRIEEIGNMGAFTGDLAIETRAERTSDAEASRQPIEPTTSDCEAAWPAPADQPEGTSGE